MLCQKCHKNLATVRYAEVVGGKVNDLHLCEPCMAAQQGDEGSGFKLSGAAPAPTRTKSPRAHIRSATQNVTCESCGVQFAEVARTSTLGCAVCYDSFRTLLDPLLREIQVAVLHRGKTPHVDNQRERLRNELQTKRALLRSALKSENYEEAAVLRDEIRALEERAGLPSAERN